jgi:hypothetical protein
MIFEDDKKYEEHQELRVIRNFEETSKGTKNNVIQEFRYSP